MERLRDAGARPNDLDPEDQVGWLACLQAFRSRRTCTRTFSTAIPGSYVGARQYCLDTLSRIAGLYYTRPGEWRAIADKNEIDDPRRLDPGTLLSVPSIR